MKYLFVLLLSICLLSSCDKEDVDLESKELEEDALAQKYHFIGRSIGFSVNQIYTDQTIDQQFYLGSIWGLKDTMPTVALSPLHNYIKPFKSSISSTHPTLRSVKIIPSFAAVRSFAKKSKGEQTVLDQFSTGTFFDYRAIRYHLNNSADVDSVLRLVVHNDSTTVKRVFSILLHREHVAFNLYADFDDFASTFHGEELLTLEKTGLKPYYVSSVNYGTNSIIMGESDYPGSDFKRVLEKLLDKQSLTNMDEEILQHSDVLIYLRGGRKASFIQREHGLEGIRKLVKAYKKELEVQRHTFDYPISYTLSDLATFRSLKFWYSYDFFVREERE
ncbi:hypothetical protein HX021_00260 [Sphingobacterium sp. N143]|uniref:hypothetical protein n=1 Tax=Sphingobacterium sp. N143 TaxID=2746727 RepID=UPI002577276C|nr:hypothetical protein [Sphingobacterium sp. N143]MDM1292725.1 hypothetical protein [Sphingobacterium sp. N143]